MGKQIVIYTFNIYVFPRVTVSILLGVTSMLMSRMDACGLSLCQYMLSEIQFYVSERHSIVVKK